MTRTGSRTRNNIPLPPELEGTGEELIGRFDEGGLARDDEGAPRLAWNGTAQLPPQSVGARSCATRIREVHLVLYSYSGDDVQTYGGRG